MKICGQILKLWLNKTIVSTQQRRIVGDRSRHRLAIYLLGADVKTRLNGLDCRRPWPTANTTLKIVLTFAPEKSTYVQYYEMFGDLTHSSFVG